MGINLFQHIYRLDNLDDLKSDLLKHFDLHLDIPRKNVGSYHRDLSKYFDDEALSFVDKHHDDDIQRYGFRRPF